jgi:hypothetical protein
LATPHRALDHRLDNFNEVDPLRHFGSLASSGKLIPALQGVRLHTEQPSGLGHCFACCVSRSAERHSLLPQRRVDSLGAAKRLFQPHHCVRFHMHLSALIGRGRPNSLSSVQRNGGR